MAISFVAAGTIVTGANPTVTVPAGLANNDLLLIVQTSTTAQTLPLPAPAGWTLASYQPIGSLNQYVTVYYKFAVTPESSVATTMAGANTKAVMIAYRGVSTSQTFENRPPYTVGTGVTFTPNTLSTVYPNDWVITIYTASSGISPTPTLTPSVSTVSRVNSSNTNTQQGLVVVDQPQPLPGISTAYSCATSTSGGWSAIQIAIISNDPLYMTTTNLTFGPGITVSA